ncbi:hypothetical protein LguiA_031022 [Lonicera macranthoides]
MDYWTQIWITVASNLEYWGNLYHFNKEPNLNLCLFYTYYIILKAMGCFMSWGTKLLELDSRCRGELGRHSEIHGKGFPNLFTTLTVLFLDYHPKGLILIGAVPPDHRVFRTKFTGDGQQVRRSGVLDLDLKGSVIMISLLSLFNKSRSSQIEDKVNKHTCREGVQREPK